MVQTIEPVSTKDYILKAVVYTLYGQIKGNQEMLAKAVKQFQLIGTSSTECDTIQGRQCIASFLFLKKQFEEVMVYLKTIKEYSEGDDDFNWNYGIALASLRKYKEALEHFQLIQSEAYKQDLVFNQWLARCFIETGESSKAWNLYLEMDTSNETVVFLNLIANEFYLKKDYYFALKSFDIMERLDNEDYSVPKTACSIGCFKQFLTNKCSQQQFEEAVSILRQSSRNEQIEHVLRVFEGFLQEDDEEKSED